ncbi:MAG TPA: 3-oxoacyl-ACP reductase [Jatrophihabitantaceae bacterium]|jgi:3-oxoacyl-[acyl-carrier protein] reductase
MSDRYLNLVNSGMGKTMASRLGLPRPEVLRRYHVGDPLLPGPLLLGGSSGSGGSVLAGLAGVLKAAGVDVRDADAAEARWAGLVYDASDANEIRDLASLRDFFAGALRRLGPSGRVIVLGRSPEGSDPVVDATRQALDGIVRSLGKELRAGATANLVLVEGDASPESALRFLLSGRSAYVDGQVIRVGGGVAPADPVRPLDGKIALVTGAARGIGSAIADVLARDGAHVIVADLPAAGEGLARVANRIGGTTLQLDIARPEAPATLLSHLGERHGGVDIVVHNAGITRDRLLANMKPEQWDSVLAVNLEAQLRINTVLLGSTVLHDGARVVCLASTSGIAGNRGQTNYAASKAGIIGMVRSYASAFARREATINAIAPGFIDTDMTHAMPFATREVARRLNSLQQAGLPVDVAEAAAWLASPSAGGINGQVLRVCGQNLVGA